MMTDSRLPNVLIIQTDQQSSWTLGCYGGTLIPTPHIDSIADEGARFTNFFANSAVCTPARGSFLTGRYPHHHKAYRNGEAIGEDEITFAHLLGAHGYETGYAGKWHLDGQDCKVVPKNMAMGFEDSRFMINGHLKEVLERPDGSLEMSARIGDEHTYMTDWLTRKTMEFIERPRSKPFLFMVSIPDPHQPFHVRSPYDTMFEPDDMPVPDSFYQEELPDWADQDEWGRNRYFPIEDPEREAQLKRIKASYCGEVKCIDDNVGKIVDTLKKRGIYNRTLIIFTTDHGEYMGEHGLLEKNNLYESAYRIPLIMRWPEQLKAGSVVDRIVSIVDFQQTLLGLLGLPPCGREQGRDASPLLRGDSPEWTDEAFIHPNDVPRAGIFTPDFELAYVGRGWKREENHAFRDHILFDRRKDPNQLHNLFGLPEYTSVIHELTDRIIAHHQQLGTAPALLPEMLQSKFVVADADGPND
ncbi:sulfatase-like hydrolase/transferase [Paenibacillus sp. HB172176]|uniref:sulfatase family protein n=1 Tax=Paenibacillus sp. HB172176 TaxID=2493690 RepID=UPI0019815151|nr:sulfatase-like hydrolase/transferase [Paenibacillus sp. HB172176]